MMGVRFRRWDRRIARALSELNRKISPCAKNRGVTAATGMSFAGVLSWAEHAPAIQVMNKQNEQRSCRRTVPVIRLDHAILRSETIDIAVLTCYPPRIWCFHYVTRLCRSLSRRPLSFLRAKNVLSDLELCARYRGILEYASNLCLQE